MSMARRRLFALAAIAVACSAVAVPAVAEGSTSPTVVIRSVDVGAFPTVAVTVSVPGDVAAGAVQITENGYPVQVLNRRSLIDAGGTLQIVLAIDTSNSVHGVPLASAVEAATAFIQGLPTGVGVGLVTFSDRARVVSPIAVDHAAALQALASMTKTRSGTALYDGLATSAGLFSIPAQRSIVLLTDGANTTGGGDLAAATAAATDVHAAVYTVGLGASVDTPVLQQIADSTNGTYTPAADVDLISIYQGLAKELSNQYVIQYRSHAAGGVQLTIGAQVGTGPVNQAFVQAPRLGPPPPASPVARFLASGWGMASLLALFFLVALTIGLMLAGSGIRARRDRDLARRMSVPASPSDPASRPGQGPGAWIPQPVAAAGKVVAEVGGFEPRLERKLERAGVPMSPGEFVAINVSTVALAVILGLVLRSLTAGIVLVLVGAVGPSLFLNRKLHQRLDDMHRQLADVLMILASSMRAGHSFLQALDTVSKEVGAPSGPEFARVVTEIRLGRSPDDALTALAERVGTEEFRWAMMAVNVQREVGGNLAEVLDTLAQTVREREAVRRQIRVLSAEGRVSMWILTAIPPGICLYIARVNPSYMRLLWTTRLGWLMIVVAVVLMSVGFAVARKVVRIDV